jgi:hypothetical protein
LEETKHTNFSKTLLSKWWKEKYMSFVTYEEIPAKAKSGGMVFGWTKTLKMILIAIDG